MKNLNEGAFTAKSVITTGTILVSLGIAFGVKACDVKLADKALNELGSLETYNKYNQDKKGEVFFDTDTKQKAMYTAIVGNARKEGISIEKSAKTIMDSFGKKLSIKFKSVNNFKNIPGTIEGVSVGKSSDGSRLVRVDFSWKESRTSSSDKHTYYVTKTGSVYIPEFEANQYGIDDQVDNDGHHTVTMGGATFEFEEAAKRRILRKSKVLKETLRRYFS